MLNWLKERMNKGTDEELAALQARYDGIFAEISEMRGELLQMRQAFAEGGTITWEQLGTYTVSTPEDPVGYPTGKHCVSYRLPDISGCMIFRTVCVAPQGEIGSFGWHEHPKTSEMNVQIEGMGRHNRVTLYPHSVTKFGPGESHDYELMPGASLITVFEKVLD